MFSKEKSTLEQLEKARTEIKRKFDLLIRGKKSMKKQLDETFKPLTNPLQKLSIASSYQIEKLKQTENLINQNLIRKKRSMMQMNYRTKPQIVITETMMISL